MLLNCIKIRPVPCISFIFLENKFFLFLNQALLQRAFYCDIHERKYDVRVKLLG
jgi:hypothetical protein